MRIPILRTTTADQGASGSLPASHAAGGQTNTVSHGSFLRRAARRAWDYSATWPRLCGLLWEMRNFLWRSGFQSRLLQDRPTVDLGPAVERDANGRFVPNKRTRARSDDIGNFFSNYPRATMIESWVFLQGWDAGERYAHRNSGTGGKASESP